MHRDAKSGGGTKIVQAKTVSANGGGVGGGGGGGREGLTLTSFGNSSFHL